MLGSTRLICREPSGNLELTLNIITLSGRILVAFCPFGHRSGSMACTRVGDFFRYVMHQRGDVICNCVDDLIGIETSDHIFPAFQYHRQLLEELGLPISTSKLISPTKECNCLGVIINTKTATISVPGIKVQEIVKNVKKSNRMLSSPKKSCNPLLGH